MSTPASAAAPTGRRRGRRAAAKVPCDDCIARASEKKEEGAAIELCTRCTATLHRPRRKQQEQANVKRVRQQSTTSIDSALTAHTDSIGIPWSNDQQEQHNLQFFVTHSAPQLASYFDSPFWQRLVLQAGRHEPAVRHAIAAIGALHERLLTGAMDLNQSEDKRTTYALEQCNKSIQHLVKSSNPKSKPDLQLMLTTCVLYTCFEALQGHCEQAIVHATQGYSLLQQYSMDPESRRWDVGAFAIELDQLCLLMRRLQTQSKGLMGKDFNIFPDASSLTKIRPSSFTSLQEAQSTLEHISTQLTVLFLDMELDDQFYQLVTSSSEKQLVFAPWLAQWEEAYSDFLSQNHKDLSEKDRRDAMILKAHHLVAEVLSGVDLALAECGWDAFPDKFAAIVNLASAVLRDKDSEHAAIGSRWNPDDDSISAPSASLSFRLGIVDPLFEVCARCRDSTLRDRALDLLANHPRQDYIWSSWSVWKMGKLLMQAKKEEECQLRGSVGTDPPGDKKNLRDRFSLAERSADQAARIEEGLSRAIPRVMARHALNPGLFEAWTAKSASLAKDTAGGLDRQDSKVASMEALLTPESNAATILGLSESYGTPDWIDYEGSQHATALPPIIETPPES